MKEFLIKRNDCQLEINKIQKETKLELANALRTDLMKGLQELIQQK